MLLVTAKRQVNVSPNPRGNVTTKVATMPEETPILSKRKSAGQTFPQQVGETLGNAGRVARPSVSPGVCLVRDTRGRGTHGPMPRRGGVR